MVALGPTVLLAQVLCKQCASKTRATLGQRATKRMAFNLVGRATLRKTAETLNLLTARKRHDVTRAESMRSAPTERFDCKQYVAEVLGRTDTDGPLRLGKVRDGKDHGPLIANFSGLFYGHRGTHPAIHALGAYEFALEWRVVRAVVPSRAGVRASDPAATHCVLTDAGREKLRAAPVAGREDTEALVAGDDYVVRSGQVC